MGRCYKNSPIAEALCEFRFEPSVPWDLTIPGLVYEKIRETFPKKRQAKVLETSLSGGRESIQQQVKMTERIQFLRGDEKALVQVGSNLLAVNHLKPYPTWQEFLPLIRQGFNAYLEVATPTVIQRIGLRYINRIEIPGQRIELEDYFEFYPFIAPNLPQDLGSFIVGIVVPYDSRDSLRLQITTAPIERPNTVAVLLDLDYFLAQPGQVSLDKVFEWVEVAHTRVEEAFEACITDRLRQIFEEMIGK